jgi:multifunctional beta-oxidation protein
MRKISCYTVRRSCRNFLICKPLTNSTDLSIGARREDQHLVYEGSKNFQVIPTYGAIPWFPSSIFFDLSDIVPNFKFEKLVHADHYLEIRKFPIPTAGTLITFPKLIEVVDKGKATIVVSGYTTKVAETGEDIFYNEASAFVRGSGNFGSQSQPSRREPMTLVYPTPERAPDTVVRQKTSEEQAAIYRLNGDMTSVHIDPNVSQKSGFKVPILHGLCSLGFSGQHILRTYGPFKSLKARFVGHVFSGQTLQTEMWREKDIVIFRTTVIESGKVCIEMAGARLVDGRKGVL